MLERKNAFLAYKNKKFKKLQNIDFSKGVNPWFWSKNGYYPFICLGHIGQENVFQDILERKNVFLGYKNKKFQKSKNIGFSKVVNPCFWSKNGYYPIICLGNTGQQNVFQDILDRKNAFLEYKNISLKNLNVQLFSNGLIHRFFKKNLAIFPSFFLGNIGQENVVQDILERKKSFQNIKTRTSKSRKIQVFPKGLTHGFDQIIAIFSSFFRQYRLGKCVLGYSRTRKRLSRL